MMIGEAPGAEEDKAGFSFVGRSGKLLDKIMASIGLDTNKDILIANVVKSRPPENRAPQKNEVEACRPYLLKQIELVQPKLFILLGATAFKHVFLPETNFKGMAGAVGTVMQRRLLRDIEKKEFPVVQESHPCMILYHPAYLLYDPRKKADMWTHMKLLREYLVAQKLLPKNTNFNPNPEKLPF